MTQPDSEDIEFTVELTAVVIAVRDGDPYVLTIGGPDADHPGLPSGPLQPTHRTLQAGVRNWVETQTELKLGYVEQLYTFGDRTVAAETTAGNHRSRRILIAYLALASISDDRMLEGRWRPWYEFFPWEDTRAGRNDAGAALTSHVLGVVAETANEPERNRVEEARTAFAIGEFPWDEERALERYEMLYDTGLVPEAWYDKSRPAPQDIRGLAGAPMQADHRRILATAMSRLRAKIKYRPVLFELMPPTFTLLQLQKTAEALSGVPLHKQNFRRLVMNQGLVEETGAVTSETGGRPAKLMRFRSDVTLERSAPGVRVHARRRSGDA